MTVKVTATLEDVLDGCVDAGCWLNFCEEFGFSEWAVNEGGSQVEVTMTVKQAVKYGLLGTGTNSDS